MNVLVPKPPLLSRPSADGFGIGAVLPWLLVGIPYAVGALDPLLREGWLYFLMPVFAGAGLLTFFFTWVTYDFYHARMPGAGLANGLLLGGTLAGATLLWVAAPDRPWGNRLILAASGGPLLVGFWLWIGSLLAYAAQQSRHAEADRRAGKPHH